MKPPSVGGLQGSLAGSMVGGAGGGAGTESVRSGVPGTVKESSADDYDRKRTIMTSHFSFRRPL